MLARGDFDLLRENILKLQEMFKASGGPYYSYASYWWEWGEYYLQWRWTRRAWRRAFCGCGFYCRKRLAKYFPEWRVEGDSCEPSGRWSGDYRTERRILLLIFCHYRVRQRLQGDLHWRCNGQRQWRWHLWNARTWPCGLRWMRLGLVWASRGPILRWVQRERVTVALFSSKSE